MEIRKMAELYALYPEAQEGIVYDSPELLLMKRISENDPDGAAALFPDRRQFSGALPAVDAPYGRFEGKEQIRAFAEGFAARFGARGLDILPKFQTRSGGRSVTEMVLNFEVDGMIDQVPMFVVADLGSRGTLEEVRLYCHSSFVPHLTPYRKPLFTPAHLEMGDPGLLTGAVREYYTALHHVPRVDVERILRCMHPDCVFGGYGLYRGQEPEKGTEALRRVYTGMASYIPEKVGMRYETGSPCPASPPICAGRTAGWSASASATTPGWKRRSTGSRRGPRRRKPGRSTRSASSPPASAGNGRKRCKEKACPGHGMPGAARRRASFCSNVFLLSNVCAAVPFMI